MYDQGDNEYSLVHSNGHAMRAYREGKGGTKKPTDLFLNHSILGYLYGHYRQKGELQSGTILEGLLKDGQVRFKGWRYDFTPFLNHYKYKASRTVDKWGPDSQFIEEREYLGQEHEEVELVAWAPTRTILREVAEKARGGGWRIDWI